MQILIVFTRNKGVRIESVLDIVHPVGEQMKYQREIQAVFTLSSKH